MLELLEFAFMRRALAAALLVGFAAPLVGIFIVQRRLALIGDGMGHVALTGVAIGLLTSRQPVLTALAVTVVAAVVIELVRARGRTSGDVVLAIMFYGGIAGGVVLVSKAQGGAATLNTYLFGAITTTTADDLAVFAVLAAVLVLAVAGLGRQLFLVSEDEEFARAAGMPVLRYNILLVVLVAVTVVLSMRIVGLLLISALMVVPVATAQLVAPSFRATLALAVALGLGASVGGVVLSYSWNTPSGGTIVILAVGVFALVAAVTAVADRRRRTVELLPQAQEAPAPTPPA
jgi:zinc transport system permease protein